MNYERSPLFVAGRLAEVAAGSNDERLAVLLRTAGSLLVEADRLSRQAHADLAEWMDCYSQNDATQGLMTELMGFWQGDE